MNYKQINFEERVKIEYLFSECKNRVSYIASEIKRSKSTIAREIKRNSTKGKYIAIKAQSYYLNRFISKHKSPESCTQNFLAYLKNTLTRNGMELSLLEQELKLRNQTFQYHL